MNDRRLSAVVAILLGYSVLFHPRWSLAWKSIAPQSFSAIFTPQLYFLLSSVGVIVWMKIPLSQIFVRSDGFARRAILGAAFALIPFVALGAIEALRPVAVRPCALSWSAWDFFTLFVMAPVSEELLFRGLLLSALLTHFSQKTSIVLGAVLFMFAHGLWAFGPLFLGVVAGFWTLRHRSIAAGLAFHAVSNAYIPVLCKAWPHAYAWIAKLPLLIR